MKDLFEGEIMAFIPEYIDSRGNCTILYRKDFHPLILDKSIRSVLRLIGRHYLIDLKEMKNRYRPLMSSRNLIPIALSQKDILIPFKTRVPMYKNDGAFAYINMKYIREIKADKGSSLVTLEDGFLIKCLCSISTVEKHMRNGEIVSRCYQNKTLEAREAEEFYKSLIPATKADIDMLYKQLQQISPK